MLDRSLLDRFPLRRQKAGTDALGENLEEGNGVLNFLEVEGDLEIAAEAPPLAPGVGVFIEEGGREPLYYCLFCSMLVSCCLYPDGRGNRLQGLLCGKFVRKLEINFRSGR